MKKVNYTKIAVLCLFVGLQFLWGGCSSTKEIPYFTNLPDSVNIEISKTDFVDPKIQPDDILSVTIQTTDPRANSVVNQRLDEMNVLASSSAQNLGSQQVSGYLVDKNGEIELPLIGKVKVSGLSTFEARALIREKAELLLVKPNVQVRFMNFKVTVIGEVGKPATYAFQSEKVSILDALGMAGDLTIYGKRENVLLMRDTPKGKEMIRFNLNNTDFFNSPYYYLRQNDIIYVEPNKAKVANTDGARTRTITIAASVISLAIVALTRLF